MKKLFLLIGAIASCFILSSCEVLEDTFNINIRPYEPKYVISIHNFIRYPRGLDIEKTLMTIDGKKVIVNRNALIDSSMIMDAVALQREDDPHSYDISLKLNQTALKIWIQLSYDNLSNHAILLDGHYHGVFKPDSGHDEDTEWVTLRGPFTEVFANGIEKFAKRNYRELNPSPSSF